MNTLLFFSLTEIINGIVEILVFKVQIIAVSIFSNCCTLYRVFCCRYPILPKECVVR